jgi:hypothetical protein
VPADGDELRQGGRTPARASLGDFWRPCSPWSHAARPALGRRAPGAACGGLPRSATASTTEIRQGPAWASSGRHSLRPLLAAQFTRACPWPCPRLAGAGQLAPRTRPHSWESPTASRSCIAVQVSRSPPSSPRGVAPNSQQLSVIPCSRWSCVACAARGRPGR